MSISRLATRNLKPILFVALVLCAAGAVVLTIFPVGIIPSMTFPRLIVIASDGDAPAKMVVASVTRPLEEVLATVPGVTRVRSTTQRGDTEITVDFVWRTNMMTAMQLANTRIGDIRQQLPPDATVQVQRMNPTLFPILGLSLKSKKLSLEQLWTLATYTLRPALARVPGVAEVVIQGGRVPEIAVNVDPVKLASYHLSLNQVGQALAQANVIRSVGRIDRRFQQYQALVSGQTTDPSELGGIVVAQHSGVPIYLSDVARIFPSVKDRTTVVTADGSEAVLVNIVRQPNANTVAVVDGVDKALAQLKPRLPAGIAIKPFYDQSILIHAAIGSVRDAVLIGSVLAVIVLLLFLGDLRTTLVTTATIPATLLITFLLLRAAGLTLNLMTLGALAIGIGLVIDDAIVVVENIYRHLSRHESHTAAVERATDEIARPMVACTLTTTVVFLPLVLLTGVAGAFFTALAITLILTLAVSLGLAMLVSPSLSAAFLRPRHGAKEHGPLFARVVAFHEGLLRRGLRHWWIVPLATLAVVGGTVYFGTHLKSGFMPEMDEGAFILDYWTPPGTSLKESDRILRKIEKILEQTPEVKAYSRRTGTQLGFAITEPNTGDFAIMLKAHRHRSIDAVIDDVRKRVERQVPGVQVDFAQVLQDLIGDLAGSSAPVAIEIFGQNQTALNALAERVAAKLGKIPGAVDVASGVVESGPQLVVRVNPAVAGRAGLTTDAVADQVDEAMYGKVVTHILEGDRQIGVRVRYPVGYRSDLKEMQSLPIHSPDGYNLPLSSMAHIITVPGTTEIDRENQQRMLSVTARLSGRDLGSVMRDVKAMMAKIQMPPGFTYVLGGQYQSQKKSFRSLIVVLVLAILLVFSVMLFQFRSFTAPLAILMVMPLSLFGVTLALYLTGTALNVSSFMGAIMLVGIIGENSILLFDQAQKAEAEGVPLEDAVVQAGRVRLRPILMTAVAAILALLPLSLGLGAGAQMQQPLAVAVIGGLIFATMFTLLLAPLLYVIMRRVRGRLSTWPRRRV